MIARAIIQGIFRVASRRALIRRAAPRRTKGPSIREAFDPRMIAVASVTVTGAFMSILDTTMVNVAIPTFVRSFKTSLSNVQWVTTGYILALAVVVPLTRWAADRFGTRRVWLVSVVLFTCGSLLCGLSWSLPTLIVARVIQGLGGGMILPTGQTILAREAGPHRLGRVMTVVGVPQFLAPLLGPVAGGLVLSTVSWRWIFFINLPIGVIALIRARRILEPGDFGASRRVDFLGMLLLSPGFALIIYGIAEFGNLGKISTSSIRRPSSVACCCSGSSSCTPFGSSIRYSTFDYGRTGALPLRRRYCSFSAPDSGPPSYRSSCTTRSAAVTRRSMRRSCSRRGHSAP